MRIRMKKGTKSIKKILIKKNGRVLKELKKRRKSRKSYA